MPTSAPAASKARVPGSGTVAGPACAEYTGAEVMLGS